MRASRNSIGLAAIVLWAVVVWLAARRANRWVALVPAVFMTYVCSSFLFVSEQFFGMQNRMAAYLLAGAVTLAVVVAMIFKMRRDAKSLS